MRSINHQQALMRSKCIQTSLLIAVLLLGLSAHAQDNNKAHVINAKNKRGIVVTKRTYPAWYDNCRFINRYTLQQRLKKYPFNKAAKIVAISYPNWEGDPNADIEVAGGPPPLPPINYNDHGLLVKKGILDVCDIREMKELDSSQIDKLTGLIYNVDVKKDIQQRFSIEPGCTCYFIPKDAILFYGKDGKIFDYIEMDFYLSDYQSKSRRVNIVTKCNQKFDLMRKWFISVGINYGTQKTQ